MNWIFEASFTIETQAGHVMKRHKSMNLKHSETVRNYLVAVTWDTGRGGVGDAAQKDEVG